jgi:hypothetical protein
MLHLVTGLTTAGAHVATEMAAQQSPMFSDLEAKAVLECRPAHWRKFAANY